MNYEIRIKIISMLRSGKW